MSPDSMDKNKDVLCLADAKLGWFGQLFEMYGYLLQRAPESKVGILRWVLNEG